MKTRTLHGLSDLAAVLKQARGDRSQKQVADEADVSASTVSRAENAEIDPPFSTAAALLDAMGVEIVVRPRAGRRSR